MNLKADHSPLTHPHHYAADLVISELHSDAKLGLSDEEAKARLERDGRNEMHKEQRIPTWRRILAQFTDTLVVLLLIATVISAVLWKIEPESALPYEAIAIFCIIIINAILGYVQESRAESAVAALRAISANEATVLRGGVTHKIPVGEVVRGDIILIEEGDTVPADARMIQTTSLQVSEAMLTGESLPIPKSLAAVDMDAGIADRHNMVFSGTTATYGHGVAIVTATGMQAEMGRIAGLLQATSDDTTPLQKQLNHVGKLLGLTVSLIAVIMIGVIIWVEHVDHWSTLFDALILGVALAVAAVPEGLPAVVTTILAIGVQRMAKRKAIVRHLAAVETLGSADVIASDKTGTLTKNEMTVRIVTTASGETSFKGTGYTPEGEVSYERQVDDQSHSQTKELVQALTAAERANNASLQCVEGQWMIQGDPTEGALIVAARKFGLEKVALDNQFQRIAEIPFSSERKLMTTIHACEREKTVYAFCKGAPDVLLTKCSHELVGDQIRELTEERRVEILNENDGLANQALRTLAVAEKQLTNASSKFESDPERLKDIEQQLTFIGLIGMIDPPRAEVRQAVKVAKAAGIRSVMITGDHPKTALVIAKELGITCNDQVMTGKALQTMSDQEFFDRAPDIAVYARVNPEDKLRIVHTLQKHGSSVAMTGDGVNDAPALKAANIGVAMGITGTDVSKQAADIILTDDNFATIVDAVQEGRAIFSNIRKFLRFLLSSNIGEVLTMFFGILFAQQLGLELVDEALVLPLLATQILWINLVTDGGPAIALGVDPTDDDAMVQSPRPKEEPVITRAMWFSIFYVGLIMAVGTLLVLDASLPGGVIEGSGNMAYAQTMALTTLVIFQLFNVFNARSAYQSAFHRIFCNHWLIAAVLFSLLLHATLIYVPTLQAAFSTTSLSMKDWLICFCVASSVLWAMEAVKLLQRSFARVPVKGEAAATPTISEVAAS